ncbi:MAG: FHA domain-containing protein [Gammaproteobacteria bacterium]|jgi:hypothetical protein|nr:FHA domain-containing protein [Gammaproteobacteria bacterium]MDP6615621.1 FHA domain-containing protein [Gammaproteobacteria bacterium]MDP6695868.1 FHA domain-containing protein [Gammaproteobacteria bacterium]
MQNSRANNDRREQSVSNEPDTDDIDAMLSEDLMLGNDIFAEDASMLDAHRTEGQFRRLQLRTRYISSSLQGSIDIVSEVQCLLDEERRHDGQFAAELHNWDRVMMQLEQHVKNWPNISALAGASVAEDSDSGGESRLEQLENKLEIREEKIKALELQLATLSGTDDMPEQPDADPYVNRVIVATSGKENLKFPLSDNIAMIGRDRSNDIQLKATFVSRFHARILSDSDSAYIEDLDSLNGVMVNSTKVRRQKLRSGDLISIGRIQLKYIDLMEGSSGEGQA